MAAPDEAFVSKFLTEFRNITRLGSGGFGVVFKATHCVDGQQYAVKRIRLPSDIEERERYLKEARVMATLNHAHIVRYFQAWLESPPDGWSVGVETGGESGVSSESSAETEAMASEDPSGEPSGSSAATSDTSNARRLISGLQLGSPDDGVSGVEFVASGSGNVVNRPSRSYMYIQMELCHEKTLQDWLMINITEDDRPQKKELNRMFGYLLDAVGHIHMLKLIHRDLKPSNIFFTPFAGGYLRFSPILPSASCGRWTSGPVRRYNTLGRPRRHGLSWMPQRLRKADVSATFMYATNGVKVGDFGLMTENRVFSAQGHLISGPARALTSGVGTAIYMSPEQIAGRQYDASVDIYALGLILFELLHPMSTGMEKHRLMTDLKERLLFPGDFEQRHPKEKLLLEKMLARDPGERPSTAHVKSDLLHLSPGYLDQGFSDGMELPARQYVLKNATVFFRGPGIYPMKKVPRGHALIISNDEFFVEESSRSASQVDRSHLMKVFHQLHFFLDCYENKNCDEMKEIIREFATKPEHTTADACVVVVMGQRDPVGRCDRILSSDGGEIEINWIHEQFTNDRAPLLAEKPKVFLHHCALGEEAIDGSVTERSEGSGFEMASFPDMLSIYAAIPGHRDSYIKNLCEMLEEHADLKDFEEIVNSKVADRLQQIEPSSPGGRRILQVTSSGFDKKLYLNPGLSEDYWGKTWTLRDSSHRW